MFKSICAVFLVFVSACQLVNGLTCYNCYEGDAKTRAIQELFQPRAANNIPCATSVDNWNTYTCTGNNPVCAYYHVAIGDREVITRSCSTREADICNSVSLPGVQMISCKTCTTNLCNNKDLDNEIDNPGNDTCSGLSFDINLNINLNTRTVYD